MLGLVLRCGSSSSGCCDMFVFIVIYFCISFTCNFEYSCFDIKGENWNLYLGILWLFQFGDRDLGMKEILEGEGDGESLSI